MLHKTLMAFAAAATLGCLPMATTALAAPHAHGSAHAMAGPARGGHVARYSGGRSYGGGHVARYGGGYSSGPIYDSCAGYGYAYGPGYGCPGYGVPLVGGLINGALGGGYAPY